MWRLVLLGLFVLALVGAACGGGGGDDEGETSTAATEEAAADTPEAATSEPDATPTEAEESGDISDAEASVVKIVSERSFVDPFEGAQQNEAGVGSGFIVSEDGLAITNHHVVGGAALLNIYLPDETDPVNAQIIGVSECSDLAVIQIEGDGHPPLDFRSDEVVVGLDVFSAGYPVTGASSIEAIDYTLTKGIVSTLDAPGDSNWASVDSVLEHDARIRGGNSGGPLLDENGDVVAINFAGSDETDQNFAITAADAQPVLEELQAGNDVDSIGINGQAIFDTETEITGIWVSSVVSGSPADSAGIEPGDILTSLEHLVLATDGTMKQYCDILRTKGSDATMAVEVLRESTEEYLEGQINGDPLVQSFSFAQEFDENVDSSASADGTVDTYSEYVEITDDLGVLSVSVPTEWTEIDGEPNPEFGPSIWASSDLAVFGDSATPGIIFEASPDLTVEDIEEVLDTIDFSDDCIYDSTEDFEDAYYIGTLDLWTDCGDEGFIVFGLAAVPPEGDFVIRMIIVAVEQRDLHAADTALSTFFVNP